MFLSLVNVYVHMPWNTSLSKAFLDLLKWLIFLEYFHCVSFCFPKSWLIAKMNKLSNSNWGEISLGWVTDTLYESMLRTQAHRSMIFDHDFLMNIFYEFNGELSNSKKYFKEKEADTVILCSKKDNGSRNIFMCKDSSRHVCYMSIWICYMCSLGDSIDGKYSWTHDHMKKGCIFGYDCSYWWFKVYICSAYWFAG